MTAIRIGSIFIISCALFCALLISAASATTYYWNVADGDWSVGGNWDPAGTPTTNDSAYIYNGGTANLDANTTVLWLRADNGTFNQADYVLNSSVRIGYGSGNTGTYNLSGGTLEIASYFYIGGDYASGYFNMTGGLVTATNDLDIFIGEDYYAPHAEFNISAGTVDLHSAGSGSFYVGYKGDGVLNQTGGEILVGENMQIGYCNTAVFCCFRGHGIYNMSGGSLVVDKDMFVGYMDAAYGTEDGELFFTGGSITVNGDFFVYHADSYIDDSAAPGGVGGTLEIWGEFHNYSEANTDFDLRHTTVILHGGSGFNAGTQEWNLHIVDMNSTDYGAEFTGLDDNYAIGTLVFSGAEGTSVWYRLESNIYCYGLSIEEGAVIDLNGYNIYYRPLNGIPYNGIVPTTFQLDGIWANMNGGDGDVIAITGIPEPGTILLLGAGLTALAGVIRKRFA